MKIKYSGPPFHHFKVGVITPGVQEIEDEWALKLLKAGIVENCIDEVVGAGSPRPGQTNGSAGQPRGVAPTGEPYQWVEGLAQPVAEDFLEEAEKTGLDSSEPAPKRKRGKGNSAG